jgi:serine protease Do
MKRILNQFCVRLAGFSIAIAFCVTVPASAQKASAKAEDTKAGLNVPLDESVISRNGISNGSFAPIVKKVGPAVVKIVSTSVVTNSAAQNPVSSDPFWRRFFGGRMLPPHSTGPFREHGLGSGVIVSQDGYILTNDHVVGRAGAVTVNLQDGRQFTAKVVGRDPGYDIAVVKIDAKDLPVLTLADSSNVQVGDMVLAVGNPFGVGQTVTQGIVSATGRGNMGIEDFEDFIQTDAAINPGNSGGALVDIEGRLIGINTAILTRSGGYQGVGFAIPAELAHDVMGSLVKYGRVTRGYLGVAIQDITPALAQEFKLKDRQGALVAEVAPGGPAAKAGLKNGDVILEMNGEMVKDGRHLKLTVADIAPGTSVPLTVWRDGSEKQLELKVTQTPKSEEVAQTSSGTTKDKDKENGKLKGVAVDNLSPELRSVLSVPADVKGALVMAIEMDCAAAEAGLRPGDVIEEIDRHPIKDAAEAAKLAENAGNKHTLLRVWSNGGAHYLVVDESEKAG